MHLRLGRFDLDILSDGEWMLDGGTVFGVVPRALWQKFATPDAQNRIRLGLNSMLVRTGDKTVLVECGIGNKLDPKFREYHDFTEGKLVREMSALGVKPEDVDAVLLTHLHFDHAGWNTVPDGRGFRPTFPNATYVIQQAEWDAAVNANPQTRAGYHREDFMALEAAGQLQLIRGDAGVLPGVTCRFTGGHSDGHQMIVVESEGETACFAGDIFCTTWHAKPNYITAYDLHPVETFERKRELLAEAAEGRWLIVWVHELGIPVGTIEKRENKYVAVPVRS